jgi:hypothetical protein
MLELLRGLGSFVWTLPASFGLFFALGALIFMDHPEAIRQPITFNHSKHIENGLTCPDCHVGVETQAHATLPDISTCLACHQSALTESPEEEKIRTLAAAGKDLAWIQLTRVPSHVYFSHRRHVALAKLACADCHGPVEKSIRPPDRPFRLLTMDACIQCHAQKHARTDCNDCHR